MNDPAGGVVARLQHLRSVWPLKTRCMVALKKMGDWRIDNAKRTRGALLREMKYSRPEEDWDHDHCEGCWAKFMESELPGTLTAGYVTEDNRCWICPDCFRDLRDEMEWKLA